MADNVNYLHHVISERATEIANGDSSKPPNYVFRPLSVASRRTPEGVDGICLEWDPEKAHLNLPVDEKNALVTLMTTIARRAVKQAILENQDLFVELILREARLGRNYFDYFNDSSRNNSI